MNEELKDMSENNTNGAGKSWEVRIGGVGGQGIVLSSKLLGSQPLCRGFLSRSIVGTDCRLL